MNKKLNLLYGILGSFFLMLLNLPSVNLYSSIGSFAGYVFDKIIPIISFVGFLLFIIFNITLLVQVTIDAIKRKTL